MTTAQPAPAEMQREMAPRCARDMRPEMCPRYATRLHEEVDVVWYRVVHAEDGVRVLVELGRRDEAGACEDPRCDRKAQAEAPLRHPEPVRLAFSKRGNGLILL